MRGIHQPHAALLKGFAVCAIALASASAFSASTKLTITAANVSASSSDTNVPANANDGSTSTRWSADATSATQWLQYKLGSCNKVDSVKLAWYNGDTRTYSYTIKASKDSGATWTTLKTGTNTASTSLQTITVTLTDANTIRLESTGSNVNKWVSLTEMEVYSSGACVTATPTPTPLPTATATPRPTATPIPTATPTSIPATGTTYNVDRVTDVSGKPGLNTVLGKVVAGDTIVLADGTYSNVTPIIRSGAKNLPITLVGSANAIITNGGITGGYGLQLEHADYWVLKGFTVTSAGKGIMVDYSRNNVIDGVTVYNIGQEGVHFRRYSTDNVLRNSTIRDVGVSDPRYGEAVYIGSDVDKWNANIYTPNGPDRSDRNCIEKNTIGPNVTAEGVDIKEGSYDGKILFNNYDATGLKGKTVANSADSFMDVKGNGYLMYGNNVTNPSRNQLTLDGFQTHLVSGTTGLGSNNTFQKNTVQVGNTLGYAFNIAGSTSGNKVCSDNVWSDAAGLITGGTAVTCTVPATAPVCPSVTSMDRAALP